jgi:hypothetical protein
MFNVGDRVTWTSQAGGVTTTKTGTVVEVVPAGQAPRTKVKSPGQPRGHESYVVSLEFYDKGGLARKKKGMYWPLVFKLKLCQTPAVASPPQPQPTEPKMEPKKLVNHFIICLDRSGSMQPIQRQAVDTFNQNVKAIREGAEKSGQESTISLTTFGGDIQTPYFCDPVRTLKTYDYNEYRPTGGTPLFDAVGRMINKLRERTDASDENVSYMFIVITDGEENASSLKANELTARMAEVQKTDRWSFAFLLPPRHGQSFCRNFKIPEGNVREWEATSQGIAQAAQSVDLGIGSYYVSRAQGLRNVNSKGFFVTDMKNVSENEVKARLVDVRSQARILDINRTAPIREFVEKELGLTYEIGHAYYLLMKDEKVQHHKQVILRERGSSAVYAGGEARHLLGLPDGLDVRVRPGDHDKWDIFVQSTSVNRKLVPGTKLLYLGPPVRLS